MLEQLIIESRYDIHIKKQLDSLKSYKKDLSTKNPTFHKLQRNSRTFQRMLYCFEKARPANLASAATRIPGITPAALTSVLLYSKKSRGRKLLKTLDSFFNVSPNQKALLKTFVIQIKKKSRKS